MMKQVKVHYRDYPETSADFEKWRMQTEALFEEARAKLME
jgi:hypothetical protein